MLRSSKRLPVNKESYGERLERLKLLIRLEAPPTIIVNEAFNVIVAAFGGYGTVLRLVLHEWIEHLWIAYIDRPVALTRCRTWCWWNEKSAKDYWELREIEREKKLPEADRLQAEDEERVN